MNSAPSTLTNLTAGSWLDRYELLAQIAEGGFGQVWLARLQGKRGFEKLVAIKVPRLTGDVYFQEMLLEEARIASAIEHDNVVRILELGESGEILYIVMEWIDGEPLSSLLRTLDKKKLAFPLPIALRIVSEMCAASHAAHELRGQDGAVLNVVHRDISPQNILITGTGKVKLIDFGIVKARDRSGGHTTDGTLKGKLKYMAPEQAVGGEIDRRTDIFALGCVLYRLLAGRVPYESDNDVVTFQRLTTGAPIPPLPPEVPAPVRGVVEKALARAPEARFQTALEMEHALGWAASALDLWVDQTNIASFVEEHLHDRIATRRHEVEAALRAAAERSAIQRVRGPLSPDSDKSVGGESKSAPSISVHSRSIGMTPAPAIMEAPPSVAPRSPWKLAAVSFSLALLVTSVVVLALRLRAASNSNASATDTAVSAKVRDPASAGSATAASPAASASAAPPPETIEIVEVPKNDEAVPASSSVVTVRPIVTAQPAASSKPEAKPDAKPEPKAAGKPASKPAATVDFGY